MATNERGRPRQAVPSDQAAAKHLDTSQDTADLLTVDSTQVVILDAELDHVIADRREVTR